MVRFIVHVQVHMFQGTSIFVERGWSPVLSTSPMHFLKLLLNEVLLKVTILAILKKKKP